MMMITSYLDETGDSQDEKQNFNGMAGLVAPAERWEEFEPKWRKVVEDEFHLPYIHMSEMSTLTDGWSDTKKKKLSGKLWKIIRDCKLLPIGSIIPMDDYRPREGQLKKYFRDPYYIAMQNCVLFATESIDVPLIPTPDTPRAAMIFDNKVEFKVNAKNLYEATIKKLRLQNLVDEPAFRDMRVIVPLQAADMIAYEIYKEFDRFYYKNTRKVRFGWEQIEAIYKAQGIAEAPIMRHSEYTLTDWLTKAETADRMASYWEERIAKKG